MGLLANAGQRTEVWEGKRVFERRQRQIKGNQLCPLIRKDSGHGRGEAPDAFIKRRGHVQRLTSSPAPVCASSKPGPLAFAHGW